MPMIEAVTKDERDNLGVRVAIRTKQKRSVFPRSRWSDFNKDIKPGFSTRITRWWFQPIDLLMKFEPHLVFHGLQAGRRMAAYADCKDQIAAVPDLTTPGDWAERKKRCQ